MGWDFARYDLFGHGESEGALRDLTVSRAVKDLCRVVEDTQRDKDQRLLLAGASFGGYVSLLVAAQHIAPERLAGVAVLGGAYDFPLQASKLPRRGPHVILTSNYVEAGAIELDTKLVEDAQSHLGAGALASRLARTRLFLMHGQADEVIAEATARAFYATYLNSRPKQADSLYLSVDAAAGGDHRLSSPGPLAQFLAALRAQLEG